MMSRLVLVLDASLADFPTALVANWSNKRHVPAIGN